jgi:hypothetical protein
MNKRVKIMPGERFGKLTVIQEIGKNEIGSIMYEVLCDCGNASLAAGSSLRKGERTSCGCNVIRQNLLGKRFGKLIVIAEVERNKNGKAQWLCRCDCGNEKVYLGKELTRNRGSKSCGCYGKEMISKSSFRHGGYGTKLYGAWRAMRQRCNTITHKNYKDYGGRGIKVCEEWNSFINFRDWSLRNGYVETERLTLDRKNNNSGYSPDNCRWTTYKVQNNNTRQNVFWEYNGERMTVAQWSDKLGIRTDTLRRRFVMGWTIEKILTTPTNGSRRVVS